MNCFTQKVVFKPNLEGQVELGRAEVEKRIFLKEGIPTGKGTAAIK